MMQVRASEVRQVWESNLGEDLGVRIGPAHVMNNQLLQNGSSDAKAQAMPL